MIFKFGIAVYFLICLVLLFGAIRPQNCILGRKDTFTSMNGCASSNYKKELILFQSMNPDEQIEYLNMSREEKIDKYHNALI